MIKRIVEITCAILLTVIFYIVIAGIFSNVQSDNLTVDSFENGLNNFTACEPNSQQYKQLAQDLDNADLEAMTISEVEETFVYTKFETTCTTNFVNVSEEQLRAIVEDTIVYAQDYFKTEDIKIINGLYAVPETFSASIGQPTSYLMFATNNNQIIGLIMKPQIAGGSETQVITVGSTEETDFEKIEMRDKLLIKYSVVIE